MPTAATSVGQLVAKVAQRTAIVGSHTVAALAGATGSGKSSIFNALVGRPVAAIGARRPTTSTPTAAVWGSEPAFELLDWLGVASRHVVDAPTDADAVSEGSASLERLVLLDLPDFDSRVQSHRVEARRILELVDVFVWVTDPQKYADALLHDEYLRRLASHDTVTLVVLNQADRLSAEAGAQCHEDLVRLLAADGMHAARVYLTSARTGEGVEALRERLSAAVASQDAARQRLSADILDSATALRRSVADVEPRVTDQADAALVDALARAAGVPVVLQAVHDDYLREAGSEGGWLFTRWLRAFRADPLARLRLDRSSVPLDTQGRDSVRAVLGRSSIPPPSPSARASVALATRQLTDRASAGLPVRWAQAVESAASPGGAGLSDALDQAIVHTPLRDRHPVWWRVMGGLQALLGAAAVVGLLWLVGLGVVGWLQLPPIPTPTVGQVPLPTLLLFGRGPSRAAGRPRVAGPGPGRCPPPAAAHRAAVATGHHPGRPPTDYRAGHRGAGAAPDDARTARAGRAPLTSCVGCPHRCRGSSPRPQPQAAVCRASPISRTLASGAEERRFLRVTRSTDE